MRLLVVLSLLCAAPAVSPQTAGTPDESSVPGQAVSEDAGAVTRQSAARLNSDPQQAGAADLIRDCAYSADDGVLGLTQLEEACPGVTRALDESGYLPLLAPDLRELLQPYHLTELQQLHDRYQAPPTDRAVDLATLHPILESLREQKRERPLTWFERIEKRLRALFEAKQIDSDSSWARWLSEVRISDAVTNAIIYGSMVLVVGLALAVIVNELRVAGLLRRTTRGGDVASARPLAAAALQSRADSADAAEVDNAPALLRMLVSTLIRSGRLRSERSLTYRELCARATFDDTQQRERFRRVAELAERVLYGTARPQSEEVEQVAAVAHGLNAQLGGAAR